MKPIGRQVDLLHNIAFRVAFIEFNRTAKDRNAKPALVFIGFHVQVFFLKHEKNR